MKRSATISIIIPVHNRRELLGRAVSSVLHQTFPDFEIIVVDDASTDNSTSVLADFPSERITVIRHEAQLGPAAARNTGIRAAKGKYITFLDSDDEWLPDKLRQQLDFMTDPLTQCEVCCTAYFLRKRGFRTEIEINPGFGDAARGLLWGCSLGPGSTMMTTRICFDRVGLFDERFQRLEDWDWMLRCVNHYKIYTLPLLLARVYSSPGTADPHHVLHALNILKDQRDKYRIDRKTPLNLLKFWSTILLELSAIYYRSGDWWHATLYGVLCVIVCPFRDRPFFKKIAGTLFVDLLRRGTDRTCDERLEVIFVLRRLDIGGTEKHIARIAPALQAHGISTSLFILERGGKLEPSIEASGVSISGPVGRKKNLYQKLRDIWNLNLHLRHRRPDIVHFFLPEPYLIGSLASIIAGIKNRVMSRRSLAHYQSRHPILAPFERWLHRHTHVLLGNSTAVVKELAQECANRAKIGLIYNGVELQPAISDEARSESRRNLGLSQDGFVLTIVANLIKYKGHKDLLRALGLVHSQLPQSWRLLIVGRDDGAGKSLKAEVADLGLADHVLWAGEHQSIDMFFNATDVALLCSHEEGFSNSLIEAMGRGLPVIATAVGGNLDAVIPDETGLLVPAKAPEALGAAILRLAGDRELRLRFGAAARHRVEQFFSLEACVQRYVNVYNGIVNGNLGTVQSMIDPPLHAIKTRTDLIEYMSSVQIEKSNTTVDLRQN